MRQRGPEAEAAQLSRPHGAGRASARLPVAVVFLGVMLAASRVVHAAPPSPSTLRTELKALQRGTPKVPAGTLESIAYIIDTAERIDGRFTPQSKQWLGRAEAYLAAAKQGQEPFQRERGKITLRAYASPIATGRQGYGVYLPPNYDPKKAWPLYVALHGGSSNGNLFLGVVLGNNMPWLKYRDHLWDVYTPRWSPDWIVVAPTGYGQVMWRWMGEQDVLDVIRDVERHYNVDPDRIVLGGLSNGGVGAYAIGMRHASRFAAVQAMAGAPSWLQYAGGQPLAAERIAMERYSGMHLAENTTATHFSFYHGYTDPGPMRPAFVRTFTGHMEKLGLPVHSLWYNTGHDILYLVHRHGKLYPELAKRRRNPKPAEVRLVTGDYRAATQHWLRITRMSPVPKLARLRARAEARRIIVESAQVQAFAIDLRRVPLSSGKMLTVRVDGAVAYRGPRAPLAHVIHLRRAAKGWRLGFPVQSGLVKKPGLSGPLTDAYHERCIHVYGTQDPDDSAALKRAAQKGARGWPLWLWDFRQEVLADSAVGPADMGRAHLVLYGNAKNNALLAKMAAKLPLRIDAKGVHLGEHHFLGQDVGTRFIYPNPLAPSRYVIVQGGASPQAVYAGHNLPDFLPDYVVYNAKTTRKRARLTSSRRDRPLALGYFDTHWRLDPKLGEMDVQQR
ncbi:MAG: prolyl oligopeptidase family serine peptidase [Polyangiales bacterium]